MNIYILNKGSFEFDLGGAISATMKKTALGWKVEVMIPNGWKDETIYYWTTESAKEAFRDIHHILRKQRRSH